VCGITAACSKVFSVNATTAGFSYLIGVLWIATVWGMIEARAGVGSGDGLLQLLLPAADRAVHDRGSAELGRAAGVLATALVASHLSDRAKKQALDARQRQRETEQLYA